MQKVVLSLIILSAFNTISAMEKGRIGRVLEKINPKTLIVGGAIAYSIDAIALIKQVESSKSIIFSPKRPLAIAGGASIAVGLALLCKNILDFQKWQIKQEYKVED